MLTYDTEEELRVAVEKKLGDKLSDDAWEEIEPYWASPYDNGDVEEIFNHAKTKFRKLGKTRRSKEKRSKQKEVIKNLQRYYWYADWIFYPKIGIPGYRDRRGKDLESLGARFRETLGLSNIVPLRKLKEVLMGLGAEETPRGSTIFYPQRPWSGEYIDVKCLYYHWRKLPLLHNVRKLADILANGLDWHPAEAIAFLFCNMRPISRDVFPRVYKQGKEITIKVSPDIKPDALARLYSGVRTEVIREIRGVKGKTARPRRASLRVQKLLDFGLENPKLKGEALLRAWNERYPNWQYEGVHSLNVVISRAAKKELDRMKLGIS